MRLSDSENDHAPIFSLAEAVPAGSQQTHSPGFVLDDLRPNRWFRRSRNGLSGLSTLRCRGDWKDTLVRSSASARQQLSAMVKLGPQVSKEAL